MQRAANEIVGFLGFVLLYFVIMMAGWMLMAGCSASPTAPVQPPTSGPLQETPWVGHYASATETVEIQDVEFLVSVQIDLMEESFCQVTIAFSTEDPNGDWAIFQSAGLPCFYAYAPATGRFVLRPTLRVHFEGGNDVVEMELWLEPLPDFEGMIWLQRDILLERA